MSPVLRCHSSGIHYTWQRRLQDHNDTSSWWWRHNQGSLLDDIFRWYRHDYNLLVLVLCIPIHIFYNLCQMSAQILLLAPCDILWDKHGFHTAMHVHISDHNLPVWPCGTGMPPSHGRQDMWHQLETHMEDMVEMWSQTVVLWLPMAKLLYHSPPLWF